MQRRTGSVKACCPPLQTPMYVLGCFNVLAAFMMFIFRAPDHVDETVDDYAEDHSHVGKRGGHTPLRTDGANDNTTTGATNGTPVSTKQ